MLQLLIERIKPDSEHEPNPSALNSGSSQAG